MSATRVRGGIPTLPRETRWTKLWEPFWAVPAACFVGALIAGVALPALDQAAPFVFPFVFEGGPDGAKSMLSAIAGAMISVIGLVFSVTMVLLQLASSQFTPRILGDFASSRVVQFTLGLFIAAFVYSLSLLRVVRGDEHVDVFVPQGSVSAAYVLVLACVVSFLMFINHIIRLIQVSHAVGHVADRTMSLADHLYGTEEEWEGVGAGPTWSPRKDMERFDVIARRHGHVITIDHRTLVDIGTHYDVVIVMAVPLGGYVVSGQVLATVWGMEEDEECAQRVRATLRIGQERRLTQDVEFGIRQLLDIFDRALSPGTNDPTTAVQVLNELHSIFREIIPRPSPSPYVSDDDQTVRIVHRPAEITSIIRRSVDEMMFYGGETLRIPERVREMLDDLEDAARPEYKASIRSIRKEHFGDDEDVDTSTL